jgi:hypothetical protein
MYTTTGQAVTFCADTGAPLSLMSETVYQKHFSHILKQLVPPNQHIQMGGIGQNGPMVT